MRVNASEEFMQKLHNLAFKGTKTLEGASSCFAELTEAQHVRLIEQADELLLKFDKMITNLIKVATIHAEMKKKEEDDARGDTKDGE